MHAINRKFCFYLRDIFLKKYATGKVTNEEIKNKLSPLSQEH